MPQMNTTPSLPLENNSTLQISAAVFCTALVTMCIFIVVIMIMKKKWHRIMTNQIDLSHPISVPNPVLIANPISTANFTSGNPILEVEEVVYDEIDLSKAVEVPAPEVNQHVIPTVSNRPEPVHYDVVREEQPMLPWIKSLQDNRQSGTVQNTVDEGGYEIPVSRSNVAESSK
ncbi:hypothetical protein B566_EDAN015416 [Ephemera danica]|nr:hypothetical protein B566_EDAN015416 [Ephemera danica]